MSTIGLAVWKQSPCWGGVGEDRIGPTLPQKIKHLSFLYTNILTVNDHQKMIFFRTIRDIL